MYKTFIEDLCYSEQPRPMTVKVSEIGLTHIVTQMLVLFDFLTEIHFQGSHNFLFRGIDRSHSRLEPMTPLVDPFDWDRFDSLDKDGKDARRLASAFMD